MGYYFYFPPENKIVVARYAEFFEKNLLSQEVSGRAGELEEIQNEDTSPSEITREIPMEVEGFEPPQREEAPVRRSKRPHRAPNCLCLNVEVEEYSLVDLNEPANYKAAMRDPKSNKWLDAMNAEMQSMKDNQGLARLVSKGFTQTYGVDYEETFSPVADIRAIRILIAIAAFYDYEIWKMNVKTAFLNGYLDEDIYMVQPEGFIDPKHPKKVSRLMHIQGETAESSINNLPLQHLLRTYDDVFAMPTELPPPMIHDHAINLLPNTPLVTVRPYMLPPNQKYVVEQMVKELLAVGDYRQLNKFTIKDKFPIPVVEELIDEFANETQHLQHLQAVLEVMRINTLYAEQSKCILLAPQVEYLGHVLSAQRVATDPLKIQAMAAWPIPQTLKKLRGFLGLTGYYRRFIKNYALISQPLTKLLKKNGFHWSKEAKVAFSQLKQAMMSTLVLALPNFEKEFIVETDAYGTGYLQPLPIPHIIWSSIYMDFIEGLPSSQVYGQSPSTYVPYESGDSPVEVVDRSLQAKEQTIQQLKFHLQRAQDRMRNLANKHRTGRQFEVGVRVYVTLQPHRQLALPVTSQIHNVFHVSRLKKSTHSMEASGALPAIDSDGLLIKTPVSILDRKLGKLRNSPVMYVLVQLRGESVEDATWEIYGDLITRFLSFDQAFGGQNLKGGGFDMNQVNKGQLSFKSLLQVVISFGGKSRYAFPF
nr:hypothetical protein [Tanacetum cinerariifolium]